MNISKKACILVPRLHSRVCHPCVFDRVEFSALAFSVAEFPLQGDLEG